MGIALKDVLVRVSTKMIQGDRNVIIDGITQDSRKVRDGYLFIAVKGFSSDGHEFIDSSVSSGAVAIVCEESPEQIPSDVIFIQVKDCREALAKIASNFYGDPSSKLAMTGFTGTNGKTSCASMAFQLFQELGYQCGLISTIKIQINAEEIPARLTTPDPIELNQLLSEMVKKGCTHCFMEASSHAIDQKRVWGIDFKIAVFTNITHDHLDYHGGFREYINAKKILFDGLSDSSWALINIDDRNARVMVQNTGAQVKTYALKSPADFKAKVLSNSFEGLELRIDQLDVWLPMVGHFSAYNLLAVYGVGILLGESSEDILTVLSKMKSVPGRFEFIRNGKKVNAILDYAHTPDALKNVLETLKEIRTGNESLITVFGCGGDRDKSKRPEMARIAAKLSDKVIITSDNPRTEDPDTILDEIEKGIPGESFHKFLKQRDRKEAIKTACMMVDKGDILLLAGKGHETYQEVMGKRTHFDDREELLNHLQTQAEG
jgi:UDP-N-acetylmuramoyl-L-alanyl-D-glutamate--2,6-diaminopimelate ligase